MNLDQPDVLPLYIGDDVTDEDAFEALSERGIGILVTEKAQRTMARYVLKDPSEVRTFIQALSSMLEGDI